MTAPSPVAGFRQLLTSAEGIYGLILVAGMIVVSRSFTASSWQALLSVITTLVVFFVAHVYAEALAWLVLERNREHGLWTAMRHGMRRSVGMLIVGIAPAVVLALGAFDVIDDENAVWLALVVDVALLAVLGWIITAIRSTSVWSRIGGALLTASFGGILILLKAIVHH